MEELGQGRAPRGLAFLILLVAEAAAVDTASGSAAVRQRDVSGSFYMEPAYHRRFSIRTVCDRYLSQTVLNKNRL